MSSIRPFQDFVLVKVDPPEQVSDTIVMPNVDHAPLRKATVLRVGPGRRRLKHRGKKDMVYIPTQVKPGDRVVFFAAAMGTKQGKQLAYSLPEDEALVREDDILFTFNGKVKVDL
jgi:co-chaperonin GroES (HSP10)